MLLADLSAPDFLYETRTKEDTSSANSYGTPLLTTVVSLFILNYKIPMIDVIDL